MLKVSERDLTAPAPVIAFLYILQVKGIRKIGEDIFKSIICCFDLKNAEFQIGKVSVPQQ